LDIIHRSGWVLLIIIYEQRSDGWRTRSFLEDQSTSFSLWIMDWIRCCGIEIEEIN